MLNYFLFAFQLVSLVDPSDVWMHSLHVTMRRIVEPTLPIQLPPSIDMGRVEARMAEMDTRVSGQAKGLMDKMKTAQNVTISNYSYMPDESFSKMRLALTYNFCVSWFPYNHYIFCSTNFIHCDWGQRDAGLPPSPTSVYSFIPSQVELTLSRYYNTVSF